VDFHDPLLDALQLFLEILAVLLQSGEAFLTGAETPVQTPAYSRVTAAVVFLVVAAAASFRAAVLVGLATTLLVTALFMPVTAAALRAVMVTIVHFQSPSIRDSIKRAPYQLRASPALGVQRKPLLTRLAS